MTGTSIPSSISVESFLKLGYFIEYDAERRPIDFSRIERAQYVGVPRQELLRQGAAKLREAFAGLFESGREHVVPLSGGLDSRLLLCALLEHTPASNIHTYTYGIPGCYDYEIGSLVAKHAGTKHVTFPMNRVTYHRDDLLEVAKREDCQAVLFYNQPLREVERLYGGGIFWSGYVGDAVAGSYLFDPPARSLSDAKRAHLKHRTLVSSTKLHRVSDEELLPYMAGGRLSPDILTWDEQVLFDEAVAKFTVAHVLWKGFDYKTPLINTPWMDFMFAVPNPLRLDTKLMIDIGRTTYPGLFNLPSKNRIGHRFDTPEPVLRATFWLNRVRKLAHQFVPSVNWPNSQYNDFNEAIRTSADVRGLVRDGLDGLKRRGICDWVDFDGLWSRHQRRLRNHADALIVLASLELLLCAREELARASSS
jgi:hypothetical protein